jgi:type VI secretion system VgrG family protein
MEITTPLGDDVLFHGMHAREEMGRLSEFQLDLLSPKNDINLDDILGKNVTVKLALPDDNTRYFNGFVSRFAQGGKYGRYHRYFAAVRPWLWFLTRTSDCRIFQDMTVPDIVKAVFGDEKTADFKFELTGKYRKWTYCVQYRETDFNFVSRLMEEEGISYYIKHTDGHNTVVLTDSTGKHTPSPGYDTLPFIAPDQLVRPELEHISSWDFSREIQPGVYVHDDYDLERPSVELKTTKILSRGYTPSDYEIYDYPGHYLQKADGEQYAGVRIDEYGSQFETAQAVTNARGVCVGSLFTLEDCPREDQNCEHLVLAASYDLEFSDYEAMPEGSGTSYRCSFVAMSSKQQFRPRRRTPKPFVQGPQTAVVVGPSGDEIYTDKYGRVKVQFHWDRYGKKDENSSCWIRVSHPWAGKGWGAVSTPRIGQEVIVDFLEGDPDQPIITGRVYNAENQPPFGFPAGAVISGVKSDTHKGGGYNEMSRRHGGQGTSVRPRPVQHGHRDRARPDVHDSQQPDGPRGRGRLRVDWQEPEVGRRRESRREDRGQRDVDRRRESHQERHRQRDRRHHRQPGRDGERQRDGDGDDAADAQRGDQRDDQRRRGAGDHRRWPSGVDCGRGTDDQCRRESVDERWSESVQYRRIQSDYERQRSGVDNHWQRRDAQRHRRSNDEYRQGRRAQGQQEPRRRRRRFRHDQDGQCEHLDEEGRNDRHQGQGHQDRGEREDQREGLERCGDQGEQGRH